MTSRTSSSRSTSRARHQGLGLHRPGDQGRQRARTRTVVIDLKYPWAPFLADISLFSNGIVPGQLGGKTETEFYKAPMGTGPFKWDSGRRAQSLKLVAQHRTTGRRASRTSTGSPGLHWQRQHPRDCSSGAARRRSTSSRLVDVSSAEVRRRTSSMNLFPSTRHRLPADSTRATRRSPTCTSAARSPRDRPQGHRQGACCSATAQPANSFDPAAGAVLPGVDAGPAVQHGQGEGRAGASLEVRKGFTTSC